MKLSLNLAREARKGQKKLRMTLYRQIISSSTFVLFITYSEQSRSQNLAIQFLHSHQKQLFILQKLKTELKKSLTQLSYYCYEQRHYFCQKMLINSKIKVVLVLQGIFSETTYVFVLTHQISSFQQNPNEFLAEV